MIRFDDYERGEVRHEVVLKRQLSRLSPQPLLLLLSVRRLLLPEDLVDVLEGEEFLKEGLSWRLGILPGLETGGERTGLG